MLDINLGVRTHLIMIRPCCVVPIRGKDDIITKRSELRRKMIRFIVNNLVLVPFFYLLRMALTVLIDSLKGVILLTDFGLY